MAAGVFAVAAITGAYFLAEGAGAPRVAQASTESALLEQIANKDSTGDGLPDWQKALYGIPLNATTTDYFHLGMTDGEAVAKGLIVPVATTPSASAATPSTGTTAASFGLTAPAAGSLTDTFAKNFFSLYVSASQKAGGSLTSDQIDTLAQEALTELSASVTPAPDFKTASDIKVSGSGPDAMRAYAASVERVMNAYQVTLPEGELDYLQDYLSTGSSQDLADIAVLAKDYHDVAVGLSALPVPSELAASDLALINAAARAGDVINDFSNVSNDPLIAMLALQQYPGALVALTDSFISVSKAYAAAGVSIPAGAAGSEFVNAGNTFAKEAPTP